MFPNLGHYKQCQNEFSTCMYILGKLFLGEESISGISGSKGKCICNFLESTKLPSLEFEPFYTTINNVINLSAKALLTEWVSLLDNCHYDRWEVVPQLVLVYISFIMNEVQIFKHKDISFSVNCPFLTYIFLSFFFSNGKISGTSSQQIFFCLFPDFHHAKVLLFVCL